MLGYAALACYTVCLYAFRPALALPREELQFSYTLPGGYSALWSMGAAVAGAGFVAAAQCLGRAVLLWSSALLAIVRAGFFTRVGNRCDPGRRGRPGPRGHAAAHRDPGPLCCWRDCEQAAVPHEPEPPEPNRMTTHRREGVDRSPTVACTGDVEEATDPVAHTALPVACTLGPQNGRARLARWQRLRDMAAPTIQWDDGRLEVRYRPVLGVLEELTDLAAAEQTCCAFVGWHVTVVEGQPVLLVTAPAEAPDSIEPVAALFGAARTGGLP